MYVIRGLKDWCQACWIEDTFQGELGEVDRWLRWRLESGQDVVLLGTKRRDPISDGEGKGDVQIGISESLEVLNDSVQLS